MEVIHATPMALCAKVAFYFNAKILPDKIKN